MQSTYMLDGQPITDPPKDLFIPPDALEILLDSFSGPLDLLLYLIKRDKIDVMDIPIVRITQQYMQYIELMESQRMSLAVDYLVMAAMLAEIKSRMLLPVVRIDDETEEIDPRMALVRRLQIYEQFKQAAEKMSQLPRRERDIFPIRLQKTHIPIQIRLPDVDLNTIVAAMKSLLARQDKMVQHIIHREPLSVRDRMVDILERLQHHPVLDFTLLFHQDEGRRGIVVALLAILELAKQSLVIVVQTGLFTPIYVKTKDDG